MVDQLLLLPAGRRFTLQIWNFANIISPVRFLQNLQCLCASSV